jgi:hypothetical protein
MNRRQTNLTLPDNSTLTMSKVLDVIAGYRRRAPAVIDLYVRTNNGPHDEILPIDVLSLTAMHAFGSRVAPMEPITSLWLKRHRVASTIQPVTKRPLEELGASEQRATVSTVAAAIKEIQAIPKFGPTSTRSCSTGCGRTSLQSGTPE